MAVYKADTTGFDMGLDIWDGGNMVIFRVNGWMFFVALITDWLDAL